MALLVECPNCKHRNSMKSDACTCGLKIKKAAHKAYWIEYYFSGRRKRERIGPSKTAAEQRLREVLKARTEDRYIQKDLSARTTLGELCEWYLNLSEVKAKKSYRRDTEFIVHLKRMLGENTKIRDLTNGKIESYQRERLKEPSPRHPGENTKPATVNKEVTCLKTIFNRAVRHEKLEQNPIDAVKKLPENNVRMRTLTQDEFESLLGECADHLKPIVLIGYYMGMRRAEIIRLTWNEVDLEKGFIRIKAPRIKTEVDRAIPIHPRVKTILKRLPIGLHTDRVFLLRGKPFNEIKKSYNGACRRAKINDFTFHDLRHCALNNLRLAGNDYFRIMAISGHKTMSVFKRYNLVTEEELSKVKWREEGENESALDTNMDTNEKRTHSKKV